MHIQPAVKCTQLLYELSLADYRISTQQDKGEQTNSRSNPNGWIGVSLQVKSAAYL